MDEDDDGVIGVLLGETLSDKDDTYIFIRGALEITNAAVFTDRIAFTEETWPVIRSRIKQYFPECEITGWYMCSSKITDSNLSAVNKADRENFKEKDNVFFLVNPQSKDEGFFEKSENGLIPMMGYVVFYERNEAMQDYINQNTDNQVSNEDAEVVGKFRSIMNNKDKPVNKSVKRHLTFIYALSMLLVIVVLIIGVNSINSYDKLKESVDKVAANADAETTTPVTPVDTLDGDVETTEPTTTPEETTKKEEETTTKKEPETTKKEEETTKKPAETTAPYHNYTIVAGDNFYLIAQKAGNGHTAKEIAAFNGLKLSSEILPGDVLKIPD